MLVSTNFSPLTVSRSVRDLIGVLNTGTYAQLFGRDRMKGRINSGDILCLHILKRVVIRDNVTQFAVQIGFFVIKIVISSLRNYFNFLLQFHFLFKYELIWIIKKSRFLIARLYIYIGYDLCTYLPFHRLFRYVRLT